MVNKMQGVASGCSELSDEIGEHYKNFNQRYRDNTLAVFDAAMRRVVKFRNSYEKVYETTVNKSWEYPMKIDAIRESLRSYLEGNITKDTWSKSMTGSYGTYGADFQVNV